MTKYRTDLVTGNPLPASFLAALQEFISTHSANVIITKASSTTIQIVGGTGDAQVSLGIDGLFRYNTTTVTAAMPASPAIGSYDIYAVASANNFVAPDTDNTDYTFGLQIVTSGGTPSGTWNGNPISVTRLIGSLTWDGTQITSITQLGGFATADSFLRLFVAGNHKLQWGSVSLDPVSGFGSTNTATVSFAHGLGVAPIWAIAWCTTGVSTGDASDPIVCSLINWTTTNLTVRIRTSSGGTINYPGINCFWAAIV